MRLFNTKLKKAIALILALLTIGSVFAVATFASGTVDPIDILEDYCVYSTYKANDGYIGIPVGICTYSKETTANSSADDTEVVFYIMNYNDKGENLSNEADIPIIYDLVDEGYLVVTLDYFGNEKACAPALTYSVQAIRCGTLSSILPKFSYNTNVKRTLPAGYRIASDIVFYDLTGNAPKGVKESTVFSAWNSSGFKSQYNKVKANYPTLPEYKKKTSYDELYNKDGSPLDSRMRLDVLYPSRPITNDISVVCWASSSQTKTANHIKTNRPHDTESLLRGHAFVAYDHCYYPLARDDHYGYFNPYGVQSQVGIHTHAAAIRCVRYYSYLFGYGTENYSGFGHSKSALIASLANPHPEALPEQNKFSSSYTFEDENGTKTTFNAAYYRNEEYGEQPYLAYKDSEEEIPSNLQFCYSSMGLGVQLHARNHTVSTAPMFTASGVSDQYEQWAFWFEQNATFAESGTDYVAISFVDKGHEYVYGTNAIYGYDEFDLAFDYIDYFLKDDVSPRVAYFTTDAIAEVTPFGAVTAQFTGAIKEADIYNGVTLTDTTDGKAVTFIAKAEGNGSKWSFYAVDGYEVGHSYTLHISEDVKADNGMPIIESATEEFACVATPKVVAESPKFFKDSIIKYYSTVAVQFTAPVDVDTMERYCVAYDKDTGEEVALVFEVMDDNRFWSFAPSSSKAKWELGHSYTVTIGKNVCGVDGTPIGEDYVIEFTVSTNTK